MKKILAIWLVFYKGYSVVRLTGLEKKDNGNEYGACNVPMEYSYGHNGTWGTGETAYKAVIDCHEKANAT